MGCCTGRCFVLSVCILQLVATVERQVFDFLGYMWAPIIGNFFQILCVILGFFGTYQYRPRYLTVYIIWSIMWIGWNSFVICLYLEVGILRKDSHILNMATGSRSWWEANGIGCSAKYNASSITEDGLRHPVAVDNCLLDYHYVEIIHAGVQIGLSVFGLVMACYLLHIFTQEDDSFDFIGGFDSYSAYQSPSKTAHMQLQPVRKQMPSLPYSIEYQRQSAPENQYQQRPMTPRRVKRRSTRSKNGVSSYRQSYYQNPVTRIMERSAAVNSGEIESSSSNDSYGNHPPPSYSSGHSAPPSYSSAASSVNIMGLDSADLSNAGGILNPSYLVHPSSRPSSTYSGRPSPIYMNDSETVI